jgi:hypothetical protein
MGVSCPTCRSMGPTFYTNTRRGWPVGWQACWQPPTLDQSAGRGGLAWCGAPPHQQPPTLDQSAGRGGLEWCGAPPHQQPPTLDQSTGRGGLAWCGAPPHQQPPTHPGPAWRSERQGTIEDPTDPHRCWGLKGGMVLQGGHPGAGYFVNFDKSPHLPTLYHWLARRG